jgi:hypothetical protein
VFQRSVTATAAVMDLTKMAVAGTEENVQTTYENKDTPDVAMSLSRNVKSLRKVNK